MFYFNKIVLYLKFCKFQQKQSKGSDYEYSTGIKSSYSNSYGAWPE